MHTAHAALVTAAVRWLPAPPPTRVLGVDETRARRVRWLLEVHHEIAGVLGQPRAPVGCAVAPKIWTWRVACVTTKNTYSRVRLIVFEHIHFLVLEMFL